MIYFLFLKLTTVENDCQPLTTHFKDEEIWLMCTVFVVLPQRKIKLTWLLVQMKIVWQQALGLKADSGMCGSSHRPGILSDWCRRENLPDRDKSLLIASKSCQSFRRTPSCPTWESFPSRLSPCGDRTQQKTTWGQSRGGFPWHACQQLQQYSCNRTLKEQI